MSKTNSYVNSIYSLGREVDKFVSGKLYFSGLHDTPTGYLGHSGDYLIVNDQETGINFTGIEKIAQDLTDYGFKAGDEEIPQYETLPDPGAFNSKIVASGCDLYYSCNGEWRKIGADAIPPPETVPGCVSNLEEYNQYQEYKNEIIEYHQADALEQGLNGDSFDLFLSDVCLFKEVSNASDGEESLCKTKVIESNYKWAIVENGDTINIKAEVSAVQSEGLYFALQSNTSNGSLDFVDSGPYQFDITNPDNTVSHSSSVTKYGSTSVHFNNGFLDTNEVETFNFMHTNTEYSLGFWINGKLNENTDTNVIGTSNLFTTQRGFRCTLVNSRILYSLNGPDGTLRRECSSNIILNNDEWYYVKIFSHLNSSDEWRFSLYINGQLTGGVAKHPDSYLLSDDSHYPLSMGINKHTGTKFSNIYLQDLVIYKGYTDPATFTDVPETLTPTNTGPGETINCSFVNWATSNNSIIGDINSPQTTALINNDVSITGVFQC